MSHFTNIQKSLIVFALIVFLFGNVYVFYQAFGKDLFSKNSTATNNLTLYVKRPSDADFVLKEVKDDQIQVTTGIAALAIEQKANLISNAPFSASYQNNKLIISSGTSFIKVKNDLTMVISGQNLILPKDLQAIYSAANASLLILEGNLDLGNKKTVKINDLLTWQVDIWGIKEFDRKNLLKEMAYAELINTLQNTDSLPSSLQDLTPPTIKVLSPQNNTKVSTSFVTLDLSSEPNTLVEIDQKEYMTDGSGLTSINYDLKEGENTILVKAFDAFGNVASVYISISKVSETAPTSYPANE